MNATWLPVSHVAGDADVPSNSCILNMPQLSCRRQDGPDNTSRLVCASSDGQERATDMYAVLVALSVLIVPLAVLFNLAVVVTVYLNRRLHTVINVLVTVLCMNNVMWTGIPVIIVSHPDFRQPAACQGFFFFFIVNRSVMFATIVLITVLRYLIVVKDHSYPTSKRNVAFIVTAALIMGVTKWMVQFYSGELRCQDEVAWTPDNFVIVKKLDSTVKMAAPISHWIRLLEYGTGITTLVFCYVKILTKAIRSRIRMQKISNALEQAVDQVAGPSKAANFKRKLTRKQKPIQPNSDENFQQSLHLPSTSGLQPPVGDGPNRELTPLPSCLTVRSCLKTSSAILPEVEPDAPSTSQLLRSAVPQCQPPSTSPQLMSEEPSSTGSAELAGSAGPTERQPVTSALDGTQPAGENGTVTAEQPSVRCTASIGLAPRPSELLSAMTLRPPRLLSAMTLRPSRLLETITRVPEELSPEAGAEPAIALVNASEVVSGITPGVTAEGRPGPSTQQPLRPRAGRRRVDIVAGVSMVGCLLIFLIAAAPMVFITWYLPGTECVILPGRRLLTFVVIVVSTGSAAVFSALMLVAFSRDFRQAFVRTYRLAAGALGVTSDGT